MKEKEEYLPRQIRWLVIHCSATREDRPFSIERLRETHLARGFTDIGYHFYITRDGRVHHCRRLSETGAHAKGFNRHSIGICYEGGLDKDGVPADTRTVWQRRSLLDLLTALKKTFAEAEIVGHYQLSGDIKKACPCFDARGEYGVGF